MFLINSAFVGKKILYLSKCTVKQQLKFRDIIVDTKSETLEVQERVSRTQFVLLFVIVPESKFQLRGVAN
jgi:hypothetical protein